MWQSDNVAFHIQKELRKLAKAQGQSMLVGSVSAPAGIPTTPTSTSVPTPGASTSMPQLGAQRAAPNPNANARPPAAIPQTSAPARARTPVGIGTPQSIATPGPGTNVGPTSVASGASPMSTQQSVPQQDPSMLKRGQKRERDSTTDGPQLNGSSSYPTNGSTLKPASMIVNAKAGAGGIRPRPMKRPRLVSRLC